MAKQNKAPATIADVMASQDDAAVAVLDEPKAQAAKIDEPAAPVAVAPAPIIELPTAPAVPEDTEKTAMLAQLQRMQATINQMEERLIANAQRNTDIVDKQWERFKEWAALSATEKTQLAADKVYGTKGQRYQVSLPEWPAVLISANSPEEAEIRYQRLCGLISTDKKYSVAAV